MKNFFSFWSFLSVAIVLVMGNAAQAKNPNPCEEFHRDGDKASADTYDHRNPNVTVDRSKNAFVCGDRCVFFPAESDELFSIYSQSAKSTVTLADQSDWPSRYWTGAYLIRNEQTYNQYNCSLYGRPCGVIQSFKFRDYGDGLGRLWTNGRNGSTGVSAPFQDDGGPGVVCRAVKLK